MGVTPAHTAHNAFGLALPEIQILSSQLFEKLFLTEVERSALSALCASRTQISEGLASFDPPRLGGQRRRMPDPLDSPREKRPVCLFC